MKNNKSFLQVYRNQEVEELLRYPNAWCLLTIIAMRAKRTNKFNSKGLKIGEALIGDHCNYGMTRQQYRTAKKQLSKWNFATFRTTNKGTITRLNNSRIFNINSELPNHQDNHQISKKQPSGNHQVTTNNNERMKINNKENTDILSIQDFVPIWNNMAQKHNLAQIRLTPGREKHISDKIRVRIKADPNFILNYKECIDKIPQCPFLLGDNERDWRIDFDWLIKNNENYLKILDGNYDESKSMKSKTDINQIDPDEAAAIKKNNQLIINELKRRKEH